MKIAFVAVSLAVALGMLRDGCGSDSSPGPCTGPSCGPDASVKGDAAPANPEAGSFAPRFVVVNGLMAANGGFPSGVRICAPGWSKPLPNAGPMPLASYPGIPVGGGADLGGVIPSSIEIYDAESIAENAGNCSDLRTSSVIKHQTVPLSIAPNGVTIVALVPATAGPSDAGTSDAGAPTVATVSATTVSDDAFAPGYVRARFFNASQAKGPVDVVATGVSAKGVADGAVSSPFELATNPETSFAITTKSGTFDQTLRSIQIASDPTQTPETFFGVRKSFFFVLVGDPLVLYDPKVPPQSQTGRELRLVAVPYGD